MWQQHGRESKFAIMFGFKRLAWVVALAPCSIKLLYLITKSAVRANSGLAPDKPQDSVQHQLQSGGSKSKLRVSRFSLPSQR